jgi:phosphatidylserine decarboxylase
LYSLGVFLPVFNFLSNLSLGVINSIDLPVWSREPCYKLYAWLFSCNLNEIFIEDLRQYSNLSEFFRRKLKSDARVIDKKSDLVCPCDGRVLNCGVVDRGQVEQVKGVNYSLRAFLGEKNWTCAPANGTSGAEEDCKYECSLKTTMDNELYHCIIYLAPGDYHRFHSPSDWEVLFRRHFPGELFSVNPCVARWLHGLFNLNERAVYYGNWKHGFFSMAAVGATNVGSISVEFDPVS